MSDLDKYKEKINQVEDSGLESTSRTLAILNEVGDVDSMRCNVKTRYNNISDRSYGRKYFGGAGPSGPAAEQG